MHLPSQVAEQLRQQTMANLRAEHPDWTDEIFNDYEMRFAVVIR